MLPQVHILFKTGLSKRELSQGLIHAYDLMVAPDTDIRDDRDIKLTNMEGEQVGTLYVRMT